MLQRYLMISASMMSLLLLIINLMTSTSPLFGVSTTFFYFFVHAIIIGLKIMPISSFYARTTSAMIFMVSFFCLFGAGIYMFNPLTKNIIILLFSSITVYTIFTISTDNRKYSIQTLSANIQKCINQHYTIQHFLIGILIILFIINTVYAFFLLEQISFTEAIRTPWKIIPREFFYIYIINTWILITLCFQNKTHTVTILLASIHTFLTLSVALIVYKLGYGFDPFIHHATEEAIFSKGEITPKPFYYIGHYIFVVILSHITHIAPSLIDKYLVPISYAFLLPPVVFYSIREMSKTLRTYAPIGILAILMIPLNIFITTTPQSFANTLLIAYIFLSLQLHVLWSEKKIRKRNLLLFSLLMTGGILSIHPIAGIPSLLHTGYIFYFIGLSHFQKKKIWAKLLFIMYTLFACVSIPATFILSSYQANQSFEKIFKSVAEMKSSLFPIFNPYKLTFTNRFNLIGDLIYSYANNIFYIFICVGIFAFIYFTIKKLKALHRTYFIIFAVLICNYFILKNIISFEMLIEYERNDFSFRVINIAMYFLLPPIIAVTLPAIKYMKERFSINAYNLIFILFIAVITGSMYTAYPREDGYVYSTGYNVSQADLAAVHYIERDAFENGNDSYTVLANQTVSAAAIKEFGFKKYIETEKYGKLFYYPIPTSSPLYQYYLDMVYEIPQKKSIIEAAELMNAKTVYFVVNSYWARSREIIEQAKKDATHWTSLDDEKIYVFRYDIKTLVK